MEVMLTEHQRALAIFAVKHTISMMELMNANSVGHPNDWNPKIYHKNMTELWNLYEYLKEGE